MLGEGGGLKTRGTCELQAKGVLFQRFSGFMSLNMDHVHRRRGRSLNNRQRRERGKHVPEEGLHTHRSQVWQSLKGIN